MIDTILIMTNPEILYIHSEGKEIQWILVKKIMGEVPINQPQFYLG